MSFSVDNKTMLEKMKQWAVDDPNRIMYKTSNKDYTYGELEHYSNIAASFLQQTIQSKKPVIIFGDLQFEMVAMFLGATKAGIAYIPISSDTPNDRLQLILETADPSLVVMVNEDASFVSSTPIVAWSKIKKFDGLIQTEFSGVQQKETYYIIFTSGTTGVPKGVQISHDNLCSFVDWMIEAFSLKPGQNYLAQAAYSFDLSVMGLYPALASGGMLSPLHKHEVINFKELFTRLPQLHVNNWISTPSFIDICLMDEKFDEAHYPSISTFLFCGEELARSTAITLRERFPQARVFNTYGPTEATVAVSAVEITDEVLAAHERLPIGYVKTDTRVVIDEKTNEIILSGPSISKGYLNNAEKTAEAFFTLDGVPAYHTGDAGSLKDDLLFYEGRIDFQVKLHGHRIELEEVDHHLAQCQYVKQAIVVPKLKEKKVHQLVAIIVSNESPFDKDFKLTRAIKQEASEKMMDYMMPQRFIYKANLPITPNGKIDRKALMAEVNQ